MLELSSSHSSTRPELVTTVYCMRMGSAATRCRRVSVDKPQRNWKMLKLTRKRTIGDQHLWRHAGAAWSWRKGMWTPRFERDRGWEHVVDICDCNCEFIRTYKANLIGARHGLCYSKINIIHIHTVKHCKAYVLYALSMLYCCYDIRGIIAQASCKHWSYDSWTESIKLGELPLFLALVYKSCGIMYLAYKVCPVKWKSCKINKWQAAIAWFHLSLWPTAVERWIENAWTGVSDLNFRWVFLFWIKQVDI